MRRTLLEACDARVSWIVWLLVCFSAGVLEADRGGGSSARIAWLGLAATLGAMALAVPAARRAATESARGAAPRPPTRTLLRATRGGRVRARSGATAVGLLAIVGFSAGHERHARELERARRGAAIAAAVDPGRILRIDARVAVRRARANGDEIELWDVREAGEGGPVPERLLLTLARHPAASTATGEAERGWTPVREEGGRARRESPACKDAMAALDGASRAEALLWPGVRARLAIRISPLRSARNPGSPDREHALARRGIGARARLLAPDWVVETLPDRGWPARVAAEVEGGRRAWLEQARARLPACRAGAGLVRALALGDRSGLAPETRRCFAALGLAHLLSVSGLHVGFVAWPVGAGVVRLRAWRRRRRRPVLDFRLPLLAAALAGGAYAWVTGGNVPALRASALFAVFAAGRGLRIAPRPAAVLAAIGLLLLTGEPDRLFAPGARFSFVACAALIVAGVWTGAPSTGRPLSPRAAGAAGAAAPPVPSGRAGARPGRAARARRALAAAWRWLLDPMRASLAVSLALLPWIELEALPRALPSPLVNVFAIPWTGLVVLPCAVLASIGIAIVPTSWGDGWLTPLLAPAVLFEEVIARVEDGLPETWIAPDRAGRLAWGPGLASIALGLMALRRGRILIAAAVWLSVGGVGLAPFRERAFADVRPRLVFLDVGQADAALVETSDAAWLVDSGSGPADGSGGATLLRALRALGVDRLDGLVVSHGDLDHRGGALRLLAAMPVGRLWLPRLEPPDPALEVVARAARARGVAVERMQAGDQRALGQALVLDVLWPPARVCDGRTASAGTNGCVHGTQSPSISPSGRARNERSLVLRATVAGHAVLFAADVGRAVERQLALEGGLGPVDVLKVAHHGSRASSDAGFLARIAPKLAIVSAPCDAARGLPSPDALARLRAVGSRIGWTGRDGAVAVTWAARGEPIVWRYAPARDCERRSRGG